MLALVGPLLGRPVPQWGSPAWFALPVGDPDRAVATTLAAHAWWSSVVFGAGVPREILEDQVARALKDAALAVRRAYRLDAERADRLQVARAFDWHRAIADHVPYDEMRRRRTEFRGSQ